jgi:hypothetical protein
MKTALIVVSVVAFCIIVFLLAIIAGIMRMGNDMVKAALKGYTGDRS